MVRIVFLFWIILSSTAWSAQEFLRVAEKMLVSDGLNHVSKCLPLAVRLFSTTPQDDGASILSQSPRILTCHRVKQTKRGVPSYASELSQMVLERRLSQLPPGIDRSPFKDILKERFGYDSVWLSTTSNAVFDHQNYRVGVNHTGADTLGRYYSRFDVFLRDTPQKLWIEGKMMTSEIRFEGTSIRDAYDLSYSFKVLVDEMFPDSLLKSHFSGEKLLDTEKRNPRMQEFIEDVLNETVLNQMVFWGIEFIPFINSSSHLK